VDNIDRPEMKIVFSEKCLNYSQPGHPESPERVRSSRKLLTEEGYEFVEPLPCTEDDILLAHSPGLLEEVKKGRFFDFDTPALPNIFDHARLAAGAAIEAARICAGGEKAFSLMRPPGHHATRDSLGGFCYFNNVAIASLRAKGSSGRVAVIDFDCHHGNGTEDILLGWDDCFYLSLHQSPLYPGTGLRSTENCLNYPLPSGTRPDQYLAAFEEGLQKVEEFQPDLVAVSAGFDSYLHDPITNLTLELETYEEIGRILQGLGRPTFCVLEGGYSADLGSCILRFLRGLEE
jgi:acetoin utilization deacetylase AcuC-like enzyme